MPATRGAEEENRLNLGGGGCSKPRSCHYTPAWATEQDSVSKDNKERKKKKKNDVSTYQLRELQYTISKNDTYFTASKS